MSRGKQRRYDSEGARPRLFLGPHDPDPVGVQDRAQGAKLDFQAVAGRGALRPQRGTGGLVLAHRLHGPPGQ